MTDHEASAFDVGELSSEAQPADSGVVLNSLRKLLARLEADPAAKDEYRYQAPFAALRRSLEELGEVPSPGLVAEELAFSVHAHDRQSPSEWGLYFGPFMSAITPSGEPVDTPPLTMMTSEVLAHWRRRAGETPHPVMRARYADLLWELPKKLDRVVPDASMARVAIDAYLEAVQRRRYEHGVTAIAKATRALEIGLSIGDDARVGRARDVLLGLEDSVAEDDQLGEWGFCFDTFVEPPHKHVKLTDAQRDRLVAGLEARLARFAARPADQCNPPGPEAAALRLAGYYRRLGRKDDVARVLLAYGEIVRRMRSTAAPLVAVHWLERLYDQFKAFELHADADALNDLLRVVGEETIADMKEISVQAEIPSEEVESYFAAMLKGTASHVMLRIAAHFIPKRHELESQLRELAQQAPLLFLTTHSLKDDEGRTIARVGPLASDLEGQLLRHISQNMTFSVPWLRETMRRALEQGVISRDVLVDFLLVCPLFSPKRRAILEAGLADYVREDSVTTLHILIPQAEQAVRQLAMLIKAPIYNQRRGGGLHVRTLDDLLRDEDIARALGEDVTTYLRVLLTDARGWNLRNTICHGLAPVSMLTMPAADRVVHALLVLALVREGSERSEEQP